MIRLRSYKKADAETILSWCKDEVTFYQWTAGMLGEFPITDKEFSFVESLIPFSAFDESGLIGFFTLRKTDISADELRFGFVIVDSQKRGKGYGKAIIQLGLKCAFDTYGAKKVSLGVFENNPSAYYCYKSAGFQDVISDTVETYHILGNDWKCLELAISKS